MACRVEARRVDVARRKKSAFAKASVFARGYDVTRRCDSLRSPLRCERVFIFEWHAESKLAALTLQGKKGPPSLKLRRDSLRSPPRCERRLGGEGFEPPTLSV